MLNGVIIVWNIFAFFSRHTIMMISLSTNSRMSPSVVRVGSWFTSPISSCIMLSIGILTVQCNPYNSSELEHRNEEQHSPSTTSPDAVLANNDSIFHPPTNTAEDAERYQPQSMYTSKSKVESRRHVYKRKLARISNFKPPFKLLFSKWTL